MENLLTYAEKFIFGIMGCASVIALAVSIDRGMLFRHTTKSGETILPEIILKLRAKDISTLDGYVETYSESVYARFAAFVKEHYGKGSGALKHLMEGKMIEERLYLERRITVLGSLGNNAPFIGLLGTVLGIIKAFFNLGTLGSTGAEVVMKSISTALLATASGLLIAIPVVIANNYFNRKVKTTMQNMEILAQETLASFEMQNNK